MPSVLSEVKPRPDRGFGRGFYVGLIVAGALYLVVLFAALAIMEL